MTNARHMKVDPAWTTPGQIVDIGRAVLGGTIDLDPFSSLVANQRVQATRIFTEADDGFAQEWDSDALFINPPGLKVVKAWRKLTEEIHAGRARRVFWVGFSMEQLCILADEVLHPSDFSMVFLRKRISFVREDGTTGSPAHSNYCAALGADHDVFAEVFRELGRVTRGKFAV